MDRKEIFNSIAENPNWSERYGYSKKYAKLPEFYPAIREFMVSNDIIYIATFKTKANLSETLLLNLEGKTIKKTYLNLKFKSTMESYPFFIKNDKLYKIVENEEKEIYELHISTIN